MPPQKALSIAILVMRLQAVWPDVIVSEVVPRMCIRELRRVLGDDAKHPRFIATHPRRGYRWIAPLTSAPPVADSRLLVSGLQSAPREPLLVGREAQLAQLHGWLEETRNGARHIVFVTSEPGIGKTTLCNNAADSGVESCTESVRRGGDIPPRSRIMVVSA